MLARNARWFGLLGLGFGLLALPARADMQAACGDDTQKFCGGVEKGQGRIVKCLKDHQADLSEGCRSELAAAREKYKQSAKDIGSACKADTDQFCAGIEPGGGRLAGCLKEHKSELSSGCLSAVQNAKGHHE